MRRLTIIYLIMTMLAVAISASAGIQPGKKPLYDKYEKQLATITSARDSVRVLYYLYDLSDRRGQIKLAWDIYHTAGRAENVTAQLDMLRNLATFNSANDSIINLLLSYTDEISNEYSRSATRTFILNQQLSRKSRRPNDTDFQRMLLDSITRSHNLDGDDVYDRMSLIYQIIQYLGVDADGVLFKECLDRYGALVESLPASDYPLKNQYYTTAAIIHSRMNGNPQMAIMYDRKLLEIMDQLQLMYTKKNRKFRNYDINRFISYRRILSNYPGLTKEEIQEVTDSIDALYHRDDDVRMTMDANNQAFAFAYMAKGDYENAIPALKGVLKNADLSAYQKQKFNSMLIEAGKQCGDTQTYIEAMEQYIVHSREIDSLRKISMQREIMLRDTILIAPLLYKDQTYAKNRNINYVKGSDVALMVVATVLAILLLIYVYLYLKLRIKKTKERI